MADREETSVAERFQVISKYIGGLGVPGITLGGASAEAGPRLSELMDSQLDFALFMSCAALSLAGAALTLGLLAQQEQQSSAIKANNGVVATQTQSDIRSYKFMSVSFVRALYLSLAGLVSSTLFDGVMEYSPPNNTEGATSMLLFGLETGPWADIAEAGISGTLLLGFLLFFVVASRSLSRVVFQRSD